MALRIGSPAHIFIGKSPVNGVVTHISTPPASSIPRVVEVGAGVYDGWVKVTYRRPAKVTIRTLANQELVTRTEGSVFPGNV